jgi:2-keto-4-pentenoate hydratase/2-oxohepta-3-ene-1,7-dioic acid hydratase in catechol pathway
MQLCRFVLLENNDHARSGIFHEHRVYETDGEKAVGIHDLSKIAFLAPLPAVSSLRCFEPDGSFAYRNAMNYLGPLGEIELPNGAINVQLRLVAVMKEGGRSLDLTEAGQAILGHSLMIGFEIEDVLAEERAEGKTPVRAYDIPYGIGPFITIPDPEKETPETVNIPIKLIINGETLLETAFEHGGFPAMIEQASKTTPIRPSDLIAGPCAAHLPLRETELARPLRPGDSVMISCEPFGSLRVNLV